MEDLVQNEQVEIETPEVETPAAEIESSEVDNTSLGDAPEAAPVKDALPAYAPNFIFKAHGKENELPEMFRGLVKDADSEKQVKEIFEKAYGMENMREKNVKASEQINYYEKELVPPLMKQHEMLQEITGFIGKKDFDSVFDLAGIDLRDLQEWMYKKLSINDLPPEQQSIYNQNRELQKQQYEYEKKVRSYEQQNENASQEQHRQQLNSLSDSLNFELSQPQIQSVVKNYDQERGQGAFQTKVIKYAAFVSQTEGRELSPKEAIHEFLKEYPQTNTLSSKTNSGSGNLKDKPILPNPEAKPLSPVGQKPNSIKELKALANSRYSEE